MTVQDLRPNSQDTSAFYLGNIYQVLADPNVTLSSVPTPVATPPPFSRPRYAVWVNSLWFLSLVMSLSCALWATSLHQWARRYIRLTQPARCSPEKRARIRALFANGVEEMHVPWAVEGLPTLLHLSLFLFFGGLAIFLFNVDHDVFTCVFLWIVLFLIVYGLVTLLPFIRHDSPYNTPLSIIAWFLYARMQYLALKFLVRYRDIFHRHTHWLWIYGMKRHLDSWKSESVEKKAEELAEEQSSEIDVRIFGWTISALGDDDSLEKFFEAIPGFFNSRLVDLKSDFPLSLLKTLWDALDGFMGRTTSSNSVTETVKYHRDIICGDIISMIPHLRDHGHYNLYPYFNQTPVSIEKLQAMGRWFAHFSRDVSDTARNAVIRDLPRLQERDGRWIRLAGDACGLAADEIDRNVALGGDNMLLATLICISRKTIDSDNHDIWRLLEALTQIDIRHTFPELQHGFCTLWNELIQDAGIHRFTRGRRGMRRLVPGSSKILEKICCLYITLHPGTDAIFSPFIEGLHVPYVDGPPPPLQPEYYPLCDIASHRPDSTPHFPVPISRLEVSSHLTHPHSPDTSPRHSTSDGNTVSQQVNQANIIQGPPSPSDPTASIKIGDNSQIPAATEPALPGHTSPRPTDASPPVAIAAALQDIPRAATSFLPPEGTTLQDIVGPCAEPDTSEILSTPTPEPVPEFTSRVMNESSKSDATSTSHPLLSTSSVIGFSVPTSPPFLDVESLALPDGTTLLRSTGNDALAQLHASGIVNTASMCFANAVLQLLVNSPPLWDMFRDLKGQRRAGSSEIGDGATPLVDATVKLFEEFMNKEKKSPPTQQPPRQLAGGNLREDEEEEKESNAVYSFEPTYIYDAIKEKRQLKRLLVRSFAMSGSAVTDMCRTYVYRMANSGMRKSFSASTLAHLTKSCSCYLHLLVVTTRLLPHSE